MKALNKMDNLDKAGLLCKLFPEQLENLQNAIKTQCEYFLQNETAFREGWYQRDFSRLNFGTGLCRMHKKGYTKMNRFGSARTGLQTIFLTDTIQFSPFTA
ncbi:hypothetical protein LWM68_10235 [Niabella sp. W65]|nr:hypothetical protein [Niabella sp. W65]MCH7363112.1 hypothetical protein [Niabella sp. W65]ULT39043.1 hypothetical protein KRR40_28940 [Niabella sp. I65]